MRVRHRSDGALEIGTGETPTFGVFVQANGAVAFDPAAAGVFVRVTAQGLVRGLTSVALETR